MAGEGADARLADSADEVARIGIEGTEVGRERAEGADQRSPTGTRSQKRGFRSRGVLRTRPRSAGLFAEGEPPGRPARRRGGGRRGRSGPSSRQVAGKAADSGSRAAIAGVSRGGVKAEKRRQEKRREGDIRRAFYPRLAESNHWLPSASPREIVAWPQASIVSCPVRIEGTGGAMRIAVTGGTGFVGSHVVELLLRARRQGQLPGPSRGRAALARGDSRGDRLRFFEGSVTDSASLGPFLEGCDAIVNIAGLTRAKTEEGFIAVNAGGAVNLVEAALALPDGPRHIISMSSLAASGPCPDGTLPRRGRRAKAAHALREEQGRARGRPAWLRGPHELQLHPRARRLRPPRPRLPAVLQARVARPRVIVGERNVMSLVYVKTLARPSSPAS